MATTPVSDHDWTVHSINIHGVFFERWCQKVVSETQGWSLDSTNYPVEFPSPNGPLRGKESTLDIRASRVSGDHKLWLLIECKKNNPEFINWVFFSKFRTPLDAFNISQVENKAREAPATGLDARSAWSIREVQSTRGRWRLSCSTQGPPPRAPWQSSIYSATMN